MKLGLALRELHRSERSLARELLTVSDRHHAEHEIHHVARDLAGWSRNHTTALAEAGRRYGVRLSDEAAKTSGVLAPVRTALSDLTRTRAEPGLLLLADLRRKAVGVSLDWELLAQGAQAVKDPELLALAQRCHPETLRQLKWANAMLKTLSPQVLAS
ncbi:hypothetical protein FHX82_004842 [Amycolatopsis bartoniae]|uniref:Uncharacterized protein n=1 Tax=Amycolatopsis bartoniae TaxID=941986 RepID=A0A8H9INW1_9PSEU|nr:hypothetical protein [Amycolatopsis bartoniae]MBB2937766.1 hypothetical protein [Amycolatopsis bartoniae]TVT08156.1 hypothetical protein FNH07_13205 [Amycolatopsis bartoniae]GHF40562.1 hypothetical protein GCM10017566_12440 [Amycolatopsis bartoniae]